MCYQDLLKISMWMICLKHTIKKVQVRLNEAVRAALTGYYWSSLANDSNIGIIGHTIVNT